MKKLIACDVDGTLIPEGERWVSPDVLKEARRLTDEGWIFAFSSGRQLANLQALARDLTDRFYYITQNGAAVYTCGTKPELIDKTPLGQENALRLAHEVLAVDEYDLEMSGTNMSYLCPKTEGFRSYMKGYVNMNITEVPSPEAVPEDIIKLSVWCPDSVEAHARLLPEWGQLYQIAIAGEIWVDITIADKGVGIKALCRHLGIPLENVVAFGDNYNDIPILDIVGTPHIMANAPKELLNRYSNVCTDVAEELRKL
jgi:hypothetical protein